MKISFIITAWKEHKTIGQAIESILLPEYNNLPSINDKEIEFEIILVAPDDPTHDFARKKLEELKFDLKNYIALKDPQKGKPTALNIAFKKASGDYWILTDGDTFIGKDSITPLVAKIIENPNFGAVSGRPKSIDRKSDIFGYWGNLLADAAHHKRMVTLENQKNGLGFAVMTAIDKVFNTNSNKPTNQPQFFVISGYLSIVKKLDFELPEDVLSDDAYISYKLWEENKLIGYSADSLVYIKFPKNLSDWYKQKSRSLGGFIQLWKYGFVNEKNKSRSFLGELIYFWFPINYARSFRELFWSILLYPARLFLWIRIWWERKILKKSFERTWVRVESTK
jgi:cellulose synthase/poly-beta-1,6-N-acetylglucosamine synthase-like glycosyltransferase